MALPAFNGVNFEIIDKDGERWVPVKQVARALGYGGKRPEVGLLHLMERNAAEFQGKSVVIKLITTDGKKYDQTVINWHGIIRAAMLSNAPLAIKFRDYAENILFQVMKFGFYINPADRAKFADAFLLVAKMALGIGIQIR